VRRVLALTLTLLALALPAGAAAYPWPVAPFKRQHPIRGNFGDPRTIFELGIFQNGVDGPGDFSFHNGVDISAPDDTPVYPVVTGVAHVVNNETITVRAGFTTFQYFHITPTVFEGETVVASRTVIGLVAQPYEHVHLSEIDGTKIVNPLTTGHLAPYADHTRPTVDEVLFRNEKGDRIGPVGVCGKISIAASAWDRPSIPVPGSFAGLPVAPALVTWQLFKLATPKLTRLTPRTPAADFRYTLPINDLFWTVYARGTYQNAPRFGLQQFGEMPGRFLYSLTPDLDTRTLRNGVYALAVIATDMRGNNGGVTQRFAVFNTASGCPAGPVAGPPTPPRTP
jgi:hypothetical protein